MQTFSKSRRFYGISVFLLFVMFSSSQSHAVDNQDIIFSAKGEYDVQQTIHNLDLWKNIDSESSEILIYKPNPTTNLAGFRFDLKLNLTERIASRPGQLAFFLANQARK